MKNEAKKVSKKIKLNKLRIAFLSKDQKHQVLGGVLLSNNRVCDGEQYH